MVKKIKAFYQKHRLVIRYLMFGLITTVLSLLSCYITVKSAALVWHDEKGDPTAIADTLGSVVQWIIGVLVSFITGKLWVFEGSEHGAKATFKQLLVFSSSRIATFFVEWGINLGIIALFDYVIVYEAPTLDLGFMVVVFGGRLWAKIVSSIVVVVSNYYISKLLVFRKKDEALREADEE